MHPYVHTSGAHHTKQGFEDPILIKKLTYSTENKLKLLIYEQGVKITQMYK